VVATLDRNGFAIVEGVLDERSVRDVRAELHRLIDEVPEGTNSFVGYRTRRVFAVPAKTRATDRMIVHPLVLGVLDEILGSYQLSAPVVISIGPGERAQTLHRDETAYPVPRGQAGELVVNVMWAIDDFSEANGATRVVPGSHRWPDESGKADARTTAAVMPAGSVCIFLGSAVHGGGANTTDRPRLGVVMEYAASWLRPQENLALAVPAETVRELPEALQRLIGYGMHPPFLGYVDGRDPLELLTDSSHAG
jgi:ectoine hydroxylase-related dioxygenase (phytanoyl-CoA dioxygenase family)